MSNACNLFGKKNMIGLIKLVALSKKPTVSLNHRVIFRKVHCLVILFMLILCNIYIFQFCDTKF